jgi:hypothetical protein
MRVSWEAGVLLLLDVLLLLTDRYLATQPIEYALALSTIVLDLTVPASPRKILGLHMERSHNKVLDGQEESRNL